MRKKILLPYGMSNSFYGFSNLQGKEKQLATAYSPSGTEFPEKYLLHPEMAAAGLWSTPTDLAKFVIETQLAYMGKSNKVLSKTFTGKILESRVATNSSYLPKYGALGVFYK